jgi:hypothetical protein
MAGRGPTPKDPDKLLGNGARPPVVDLDPSAKVEVPPLPDLPGGEAWEPGVLRWFESFASSPMAAQLLPFDFERVFATARLRQLFEREPTSALFGEIRLNEAKFGGTPEDRLRLRWRMAEAAREDERAEKPGGKRSRRGRDPRLEVLDGGKES